MKRKSFWRKHRASKSHPRKSGQIVIMSVKLICSIYIIGKTMNNGKKNYPIGQKKITSHASFFHVSLNVKFGAKLMFFVLYLFL